MSRGFFIGALLLAVIIVVGLYLFGVSSSPPEVVRTSGPGEISTGTPAPVPAPGEVTDGPVDDSESGGASNTGGDRPPPQ
jgi:hypothetical protein